MQKIVGRNDPCPCGSGKKYKQCCLKYPTGRKKINAKVISGGSSLFGLQKKAPDLLERTFGEAIASTHQEKGPPVPESKQEEHRDENES